MKRQDSGGAQLNTPAIPERCSRCRLPPLFACEKREGGLIFIQFPTDHRTQPSGSHTNRSLQRLHSRRIEAQIHERLQTVLPSYMVPARIVALIRMPVNANGKARPARAFPKSSDRTKKQGGLCTCGPNQRSRSQDHARNLPMYLASKLALPTTFLELWWVTPLWPRNLAHASAAGWIHTCRSRTSSTGRSLRISRQRSAEDRRRIVQSLRQSTKDPSSSHLLRAVYGSWISSTGRVVVSHAARSANAWPASQIDALAAALYASEQRHETLGTTFAEQDGIGIQVIRTARRKELKVINTSAEHDWRRLHTGPTTGTDSSLDLTSDPGWRVSLLRIGEDDHILSIVMHHIISDGWSVDILRQELAQFYSAVLRGRDPLSEAGAPADPIP